jgi:hypothetical protein
VAAGETAHFSGGEKNMNMIEVVDAHGWEITVIQGSGGFVIPVKAFAVFSDKGRFHLSPLLDGFDENRNAALLGCEENVLRNLEEWKFLNPRIESFCVLCKTK